jgi:2-polyprenyl-6-hydroxyphenyl methylase/3-demethylubiquinone-9 3-methyltransferase
VSVLPRLGGLSEPAKYERLVEQAPEVWWSDSGPFAGLHELNAIRVEYFRRVFGGFRGKRVLDIGCGGGILSEALAREGAIVTGIDPSERSVRAAREHAARANLLIDYLVDSAETLDPGEFVPGFDLVFAVDVLEHVDDLDRTLARVAAVLAPAGGLGFLTHNRSPAAFLDLIWDEEYVRHTMPEGFHQFDRFIVPVDLTARLSRHGIRVQEMKGVARGEGGGAGRTLVDDTAITYIGWARRDD